MLNEGQIERMNALFVNNNNMMLKSDCDPWLIISFEFMNSVKI